MKSDFKVLAESIAVDEFPDAQVVKSFIADSELMTTYAGMEMTTTMFLKRC